MPRLREPQSAPDATFVAAPGLDIVNAMYFTALAANLEAVGEWPARTRQEMDPGLRAQLDLLFTYPRVEPGIMGALNDALFEHPEAWGGVDALLRFVRKMPAEGAPGTAAPGIRSLALHALRWPGDYPFVVPEGRDPRDVLASEISRARTLDPDCEVLEPAEEERTLELFDHPEDVRARMLTLIRRFYDGHYRRDEARRNECMERSVAWWSRQRLPADMTELMRRLSGRYINCVDIEEPGAYQRFIFVPSVDLGVYNSCTDIPPLHGFFYRCEARFTGAADAQDSLEAMAAIYRALGDEQRLRILALLRGGELYAQEIVERTGLHQSVVSRHLSFLKAVGLVRARRQNTMKYFSINPEMGARLREAVDAMLPAQA
jgi:DNA-binding transcriptional ArsR family regulator